MAQAQARRPSDGNDELERLITFYREEVERAATEGQHIRPKTLSPTGEAAWAEAWPGLLQEAMRQPENVRWLTHELFARRLFVRGSAAEQVAEHHFMRFYSAAVCRLAMERGVAVRYVRFRASAEPRPETERLLARNVHENPRDLLGWLRSLDGFHHSPLGRHRSGLTVALVAPETPAAQTGD